MLGVNLLSLFIGNGENVNIYTVTTSQKQLNCWHAPHLKSIKGRGHVTAQIIKLKLQLKKKFSIYLL